MKIKIVKMLAIFIIAGIQIACEEEVAKGETYAGANTMECHMEGNKLECIEKNPYINPVTNNYESSLFYGDGEIAEFNWNETIPWFLPSQQHAYGFDLDPLSLLPNYIENGKDVFASVETNKLAKVRVRVDPNSKKKYTLYKVDENNEPIESILTGTDVCKEKDCIKEVEFSPGDYAVYYDDVDMKRYLHIIEYEPCPKDIIFVQFGSENGATCLNSEKNGCYTKKLVEDYFNEIYKQAVVVGKFDEKEPQEIGFDDVLVVDFTEKDAVRHRMATYNEIIRMALYPEYAKSFEEYLNKKDEHDVAQLDYDEKVSALTACTKQSNSTEQCQQERKAKREAEEKLDNVTVAYNSAQSKFNDLFVSENTQNHHVVFGINEMRIKWNLLNNSAKNINNYEDFNQVCTMYHEKEFEDGCLNLRFPMYLSSSCGGATKEIDVEMYEYNEEKNTFSLKLHNAGNLDSRCDYSIFADVYPYVPNLHQAVQYTLQMLKSEQNHTAIGGFVWGSHVAGKNSFYVLCHEIGHAFGLTDLYVNEDDPTMLNGIGSNETNLMNNSTPIGTRIRYRPLEVVATSTNDRFKLKSGKYATENQWECIRSVEKCYKQ